MSDYDQRQLDLMLKQLNAFEQGIITLDRLVGNLEGLLNALESASEPWRQSFLHVWGKLEDTRTYALFKGSTSFNEETTHRLRQAVSELKLIVLEQIDNPVDRRTNS